MPKIRKPNQKNIDSEYWETVLESHGLGIDQPITDNSKEPGVLQISEARGRNSQASAKHVNSDWDLLRQIVDGSESFMSHAGTMKVRTIDREVPEWTLSDARVREILLRSFPKLRKEEKQRSKAARWCRIIYLYYRMRLPRQIVAKELRISETGLNGHIQRIGWAASGLNTAGKKRSGKKVNSPPTPGEGTRRKGNGEKIKGTHLLVSADGSGGKKTAKSK